METGRNWINGLCFIPVRESNGVGNATSCPRLRAACLIFAFCLLLSGIGIFLATTWKNISMLQHVSSFHGKELHALKSRVLHADDLLQKAMEVEVGHAAKTSNGYAEKPETTTDIRTSEPEPRLSMPEISIESIHLVAGKVKREDTILITHGEDIQLWKTEIFVGNVTLSRGCIKVKTPGIYCVYSQLHLQYKSNLDQGLYGSKSLVYHIMKNSQQSISRCVIPLRTCDVSCTRYQSRLVAMDSGDYLCIRVSNSALLLTTDNSSYFGLFKVV